MTAFVPVPPESAEVASALKVPEPWTEETRQWQTGESETIRFHTRGDGSWAWAHVTPSRMETLAYLGDMVDAEAMRIDRLCFALRMLARTFDVVERGCEPGCANNAGYGDACDCGYMAAVDDPVAFIREALEWRPEGWPKRGEGGVEEARNAGEASMGVHSPEEIQRSAEVDSFEAERADRRGDRQRARSLYARAGSSWAAACDGAEGSGLRSDFAVAAAVCWFRGGYFHETIVFVERVLASPATLTEGGTRILQELLKESREKLRPARGSDGEEE